MDFSRSRTGGANEGEVGEHDGSGLQRQRRGSRPVDPAVQIYQHVQPILANERGCRLRGLMAQVPKHIRRPNSPARHIQSRSNGILASGGPSLRAPFELSASLGLIGRIQRVNVHLNARASVQLKDRVHQVRERVVAKHTRHVAHAEGFVRLHGRQGRSRRNVWHYCKTDAVQHERE